MMHKDSTGRVINIGDRVKFRGKEFTIKSFSVADDGEYTKVQFEEDIIHTTEIPTEVSIDIIPSSVIVPSGGYPLGALVTFMASGNK